MSDAITWTEQRRRLGDLTPWPRNPRQIKSPQAKRLLASVQEFGQVETLAIGPDGDIYNGHQRLAVLMEQYGADYEVDVRVSSRPLTEKEREKLTVYLHKGAAGEWDFDTLANEFEVSDLIEWGFEAGELGLGGDDDADGNNYVRKIEAPIYTPKGDKPKLDDLFDMGKTHQLISAIDKAENISEGEKVFLRAAAQRHTVLRFDRIADYYAHSGADMQTLMEDNALVIIDFDRAIELGFVEMTKEIADLVRDEYGDD